MARRTEAAQRTTQLLRVLGIAGAALLPVAAQAQAPTPNFQWDNFVSSGTFWSSASNWVPAGPPPSSIDQVLGFGSSILQTGGGYTSTFDSTFDLNSLVFTSQAASNPSLVLTGNAATNTLRFNTSSGGTLPSIWQNGTGRVAIQNGTATSGMTLANTLNILGNGIGELQLNALISGTGGLVINQTGTRPFFTGSSTRLGNTVAAPITNTFSGGVTLQQGNLILGSAGGLGTGPVTISGGSVQFDIAATATQVIPNSFTLNSDLVLSGPASGVTSPTPVATFNGVLSGPRGISFRQTNGTNNFLFTAANTFSGAVDISPMGNTVTLANFGSSTVAGGTATSAASFTVTSNSSLVLDNQAGVSTRTSGSAPLTLHRGNLTMRGNATANAAETFGLLTANGTSSVSALGASATAQTTSVTFSGLNRGLSGTGTLAFTGTNLGSNSGAGESIIRFTSDPGGSVGGGGAPGNPTVSILPYAFADSAASTVSTAAAPVIGLVRWDSTSQKIVPLNTATEYSSNLYIAGLTGFADHNQRAASTAGLPNAFSVAGLKTTVANSVTLDTNTAATNRVGVSLSGNGILAVQGGTILSAINGLNSLPTNPSMINMGGLNFAGSVGHIHTQANLTINTPITASNGLIKSGFGTLALNANNSSASSFTHNSGIVQFSAANNLGSGSGTIRLNSGLTGALTYVPSTPFSAAHTFLGTTLSNPVTIGPAGTNITVPYGNNNLTLDGAISGGGQILKNGAGILSLTGSNTSYTGNIMLFAGTLAVNSDAALGGTAASLLMGGGTLQPLSSFTLTHNMLATATGILFTNGNNLTVASNLTGHNAANGLLKDGTGDLIFNEVNTITGSYQNGISGPAVRGTASFSAASSGRTIFSGANGSMPLASSFFVIGGGGILLDNSAAVNNNRIGSVAVSVIGGEFSLLGNSAASVDEHIGALSFSNPNNPYGGTITLSTPAGSGQSTALHATTTSANSTTATVFVRGTNLGATTGDRTAMTFNGNAFSGSASAQVGGLIPSMVGATSDTAEPTDFLTTSIITVSPPNSNRVSLIPFTAYTPGVGPLGAGAAGNTYDVTAAANFGPGPSAANALRISGGSTLDLGAGTLTLGAGSILSTGSSGNTITNGTLAFGALPARLTTTSTAPLSVSTALTGTAGLVKAGLGTATLNTASTALTGNIGISQGTLQYGVANALPIASTVFVNAGATLDLNNNSSTLGIVQGYGNVNLGTGNLTLSSTTAPLVALGGALSGSGSLIKANTNTVTLTGNSPSYTGQPSILAGTLQVNSGSALGTGSTPALLLGDTSGTAQAVLGLGGTVTTFPRDITVQAGSTPATPHAITGGLGATNLTGNVTLNNNLRLQGTSGIGGSATNIAGNITGTGALTIFSGNWSFSGSNSYSGGTTVDTTQSSAVGIGSNTALGTGTVTFTTFGANLRADDAPRILNNNIVLQAGAYFGVAGRQPLTLNGGIDLSGGTQAVNIMNTALTTFRGVVANGTGLTKNGPGTLNLTNSNTFTGTLTVNAGTVLANNTSGNAAPAVQVNSGAIIGGNGSIGGNLTVGAGGIVSPGNSPGVLTVNGNASFAANSIFDVELNGNTVGTGYDQLAVNGTVDVGTANLLLSLGFAPATTDLFYIVNNDGTDAVTNTFLGLPEGATVTATFGSNTYAGTITYQGDFALNAITGGNDVLLHNFTIIPEPGTLALLALAALPGVALLRRRK